jgi:hypothetical protein
MTALFHFDNAALCVPSAGIDAFLKSHDVPRGFDTWMARTLLALASIAQRPGQALSIAAIGDPDGALAKWLGAFTATDLPAIPSDRHNETELGLAVIALPAAQADCALGRDLLAACAAGTGPEAVFFTSTNSGSDTDIIHSFADAHRALAVAGYLHLHDGYFSAWLRARSPQLHLHAIAEARAITPAQQARMLFIIGHARSGTSALFELANYHPELLLLFESNSCLPRMRRHFAENFSARMAASRPALRKGFFCAPPVAGADHPFTVFPALLKHYRMVGEKIALSPRENRFQRCPVPICFRYHAHNFPFAKYIFLARTPFEATEALRRIQPHGDVAEILRLYAAYMAEMLQFQSVFPNSRVLFMEDFDFLNSAALNHLVGFELLCDNVTLSSERRTTRSTLPGPHWEDLTYELHSAHDLYRRTRAMFSTNGYELRRDTTLVEFEAVVAAWKSAAAAVAERAFFPI